MTTSYSIPGVYSCYSSLGLALDYLGLAKVHLDLGLVSVIHVLVLQSRKTKTKTARPTLFWAIISRNPGTSASLLGEIMKYVVFQGLVPGYTWSFKQTANKFISWCEWWMIFKKIVSAIRSGSKILILLRIINSENNPFFQSRKSRDW